MPERISKPESRNFKAKLEVKSGSFGAEGECFEPAAITLYLTELELSEYKHCMKILTENFQVDYASAVFRQNRDVVVKGSDGIHDDHPMEGRRTEI